MRNELCGGMHMMIGAVKLVLSVLFASTVWLAEPPRASAAAAQRNSGTQCTSLVGDYQGIGDAPTQVLSASLVEAAGEIPAYCEVTGYIAPYQSFELRLPVEGWNGKYAQVGCGGMCGAPVPWLCDDPLIRGYACMAPDLGHRSGNDSNWARDNLQARMDFGFRGVHVAAVAGKALTERFYGQAPRLSYFLGSSTGGRLAMIEAQRFPWDFNGILSGVPILNQTGDQMTIMWTALAFGGQKGQPVITPDDARMLHEAVLERCDMNDGFQDRLIGDPRDCNFDPGVLLCGGAKTPGCLTQEQLAAVRKIYSGPVNSKGEPLYAGGMELGSELFWTNGYYETLRYNNSVDRFRNFAFFPSPPPNWKPENFNWDEDYKRLGLTESFYGASNPDLRKAKAAGAKVIMFGAWGDEAVFPRNIVDYYESVTRLMGGPEKPLDFFRLFMIPGMNHAGGDGVWAADSIDWFTHLEAWVEKNQAPDVVVGAHLRSHATRAQAMAGMRSVKPGSTLRRSADGRVYSTNLARDAEFTRPIYPYPLRTKYKGSGDPNDAANWKQVTP